MEVLPLELRVCIHNMPRLTGVEMYTGVFFDFDGVILDSVDIKTQAFAALFEPYGQEVQRLVVEYHLAHGGVSRFEKFKYFFNIILQQELSEVAAQYLGERFNSLVFEGILAAPFVPGALESLEALRDRGIPAFVVSGTPEDELREIVKQRELDGFFREVHGSPRLKDVIVGDVLLRYGLRPYECILVGDAMTDYVAAKACSVPFLGIVKDAHSSPFPTGTRVSEVVDLFYDA
ncbi:phosphoglycolate phosphatase-like HAD superfamily hydrolase [Desulfurispira natronophila]|uniref:phosphoglycolate phosphatase n=1 Tax=Desulfurispira natronophila TaxID=682562 RepID=A0A7W7Y6K4_9BACT|nr:phosphoglycolate phosphatase-like HAD superfamily hydrolase [Desulfurispira natronophila]